MGESTVPGGQSAHISAERFEFREKLGSGGMGVVFRAYDRERRIHVALKILRSLEGVALYRFKREFRSLADLAHPNLVTLYELGSTGAQWFFTMELVDGVAMLEYVRPYLHLIPADDNTAEADARVPEFDTQTLGPTSDTSSSLNATANPSSSGPSARRSYVVEGTLNVDRLRSSVTQLVAAIQVLHQGGKLHRDIKPSNVLVTEDGRVALCDFGLVLEADVGQRTDEHQTVGTPAYMAPEQADTRATTEASDWYSVGIMLYEALTGRLPFVGSPLEVLRQKLAGPPARPRSLALEIPKELDELVMSLLSMVAARRPDGDAILRAFGTSSVAANSASIPIAPPSAEADLVGREAPLASLHQALQDSRSQMRSVSVFVHGVSGIGKTAIVRRFLDELADDGETIVLEGRCYQRESVPYKALDALVDALSARLLRSPRAEVEAFIPPDVAVLARLFPVLSRVPAVAEAGELERELLDPQESRRRAFVALRTMLERMAEKQPVALFIDDLQWGDLDSAGFLGDLLHHHDSPALLFLATYRREEADSSPLLQALRGASDSGGGGEIRELAIEPLGDEEARSLICEILGERSSRPELVETLLRESGGSPLFLCELARSALEIEDGEVRLDTVLRNRIDRISSAARDLLQAVAVGGQPILASVAARAAGVEDEAAALAALQSARLVRTRQLDAERRVESYHDRIRETVVSALSERELRRVHRKLARALETSPRPDLLALVEHWHGAGDEEKAGNYAAYAGEFAEQAFAFDRAVHNYRLALELQQPEGPERCTALRRIGDSLANAGRLAEAAETFVEAAGLAEADAALELKRRAVEQFVRSGRFEDGLEQAREVLADVGMKLPKSTRAALISVAFSRLWVKFRGLGFKERRVEDIDPLIVRRMEICWSLSGGLAVFEPMLGTAFQMRHLRMALRAGEPNHVAISLAYEIGFRSVAGVQMRGHCDALLEKAEALASSLDQPYALATTRFTSGLAAYLTGQWQLANERLELAESMMREIATGLTWERDVVVLFRMAALLYRGDIKELTRLVPLYLREADDRGDQYLATGLRSWRSNVAWLALDDPDEAEAQLAKAAAALQVSDREFHLPQYYRLLSSSQIALYRGRAEAAWDAVEIGYRALQKAMIKRVQFTRIEGAYLRARLAVATAHGDQQEPRLRIADEMVTTMEREKSDWGDAIAMLLRAMIASVRGEVAEALRLLETVTGRFDDDDMAFFAQVARWRHGQLEGGEAGASLTCAAEDWMREQHIACPERFVALFAPLPE